MTGIEQLAARMRRIAARLEKADGAAVVYGIRDVPHYSGMSAAELAAILFRGTRDGRIPARDFFADAEDEIRRQAPQLCRRAARRIIRGLTVRQALEPLRAFCEDAIRDSMDNFKIPPNAPSTIRRKGRDDPLDDTGDLIDAAGAEIET